MDATTLIAVGAVIVVVALAAWGVTRLVRHRRLRDRFGAEYDRVRDRSGSPREAADELQRREQRREQLDIRPLDPDAAQRYRSRWRDVQSQFVDTPETAVHDADGLIREVMRERGYPVEDFEQRAADLSVDHPAVVQHYRQGHAVVERHRREQVDTEELRQAMLQHRRLFEVLVEVDADRFAGERRTG